MSYRLNSSSDSISLVFSWHRIVDSKQNEIPPIRAHLQSSFTMSDNAFCKKKEDNDSISLAYGFIHPNQTFQHFTARQIKNI